MGFVHGFRWKENSLSRLCELKILGFDAIDIAEILSIEFKTRITKKSAEQTFFRYYENLDRFILTIDPEIKIYKNDELEMDDYVIFCDPHAPFFSEKWVNRVLFMSEKFKIKKAINIGDLFDCDFARHQILGRVPKDLDYEAFHTEPLIKALDYFDKVYLVKGNHESRIERLTDNILQSKHLMGLYGVDVAKKKFILSNYDKIFIGDKWMLVHPKSYSQIKGAVANRLAEVFHRNIINTHGHFVSFGFDKSGNHEIYDLGGLMDARKMAYLNLRTTTHPRWNNGFGILKSGKFWHFTDASDWGYWLK